MLGGDGEEAKHDDDRAEVVTGHLLFVVVVVKCTLGRTCERWVGNTTNQVFAAKREEVHDYPNEAEQRDEKVNAIARADPIARRSESKRLHKHL